MNPPSSTALAEATKLNTALRHSLRQALARELNLTVDRLASQASSAERPSASMGTRAPAPTEFLSGMSLETWCCVVAHVYANTVANAATSSRAPFPLHR
jgi:hypothetical protein